MLRKRYSVVLRTVAYYLFISVTPARAAIIFLQKNAVKRTMMFLHQ